MSRQYQRTVLNVKLKSKILQRKTAMNIRSNSRLGKLLYKRRKLSITFGMLEVDKEALVVVGS
jgi:hypothetical protein